VPCRCPSPPFPLREMSGGIASSPEVFFFFVPRNAYFSAFFGPYECLLLHCNTSRSRPLVCLPNLTFRLTFQAGIRTEEGTGEYATNLIIADVETLRHDSNSHFSLDGHEIGGARPLALCPIIDPSLAAPSDFLLFRQ